MIIRTFLPYKITFYTEDAYKDHLTRELRVPILTERDGSSVPGVFSINMNDLIRDPGHSEDLSNIPELFCHLTNRDGFKVRHKNSVLYPNRVESMFLEVVEAWDKEVAHTVQRETLVVVNLDSIPDSMVFECEFGDCEDKRDFLGGLNYRETALIMKLLSDLKIEAKQFTAETYASAFNKKEIGFENPYLITGTVLLEKV